MQPQPSPAQNPFNALLAALEGGKLQPEELKTVKELAAAIPAKMRMVPNPGPQTEAYFSQADELFYGGAGGGGKTALLCGVAVNEHHDVQLFRREAVQLQGLLKELRAIVGHSEGLALSPQIRWSLPGGQTIELAGLKEEKDRENWQGRAADLKGFDEITHFTRSQYTFIIGWNRSTRDGQRCRVIATGNPPVTAEGLWVIQYWAPWLDDTHPDPAMPGELRWPVRRSDESEDSDEIFFRTREEAMAHMAKLADPPRDHLGNLLPPRSRTFIPARLEDNPDLMRSGYAAVLNAMPKELREAFRDGKFKKAFRDDEFQVIPTALIDAAMQRWTPKPPAPMTAMGVDVAQGGGDNTVLAPRHKHWFAPLLKFPGASTPDGPAVAALVVAHMRDGANINIDLGGGWGGSALSFLKEQELACVGLNPSSGSEALGRDKIAFFNARAEWWCQFREALEDGEIALPNDPELKADLAAPKRKLTSRGWQVESKEDIKKRLGRSPDKGDAVVMAWATGDKRYVQTRRTGRKTATIYTTTQPGTSRWNRS